MRLISNDSESDNDIENAEKPGDQSTGDSDFNPYESSDNEVESSARQKLAVQTKRPSKFH